MALSPAELASSGTEHAHQRAFFAALPPYWHDFPQLRWCHAIPNGGDREASVAGRLKAEGVKAGVWDVFLPYPCGKWHGLYIEFKKPARVRERRKGLSELQWAFGMYCHEAGYATALVFTWEQALAECLAYLRS
jgi:hypothetical protein